MAKLAEGDGSPGALAIEVSSLKSVEAAAEALQRNFVSKLGGLINNAGVRQGGVRVSNAGLSIRFEVRVRFSVRARSLG